MMAMAQEKTEIFAQAFGAMCRTRRGTGEDPRRSIVRGSVEDGFTGIITSCS